MNETATPASEAAPDYRIYLKVWLVLLAITLMMVFIGSRTFLIFGMALKATIIAGWFMHLKQETYDFILYMVLCIVGFSLVLFGLIAPDGLAM